jgi:aldose 1-epimerase
MNESLTRVDLLCLLGVLLLAGCANPSLQPGTFGMSPQPIGVRVERASFGTLPDGQPVEIFTLTNSGGMRVSISNYAGVIKAIEVPDRAGTVANVVLGFDSLAGYAGQGGAYVSSLIGRYGNRIAGGRFTLDGQQFELARNNGPHHLHGGPGGFHRKLWSAETFERAGGAGVMLS